jgi:hypothetical protein
MKTTSKYKTRINNQRKFYKTMAMSGYMAVKYGS